MRRSRWVPMCLFATLICAWQGGTYYFMRPTSLPASAAVEASSSSSSSLSVAKGAAVAVAQWTSRASSAAVAASNAAADAAAAALADKLIASATASDAKASRREAENHEHYEALKVLDVRASPNDASATTKQLASGSKFKPFGGQMGGQGGAKWNLQTGGHGGTDGWIRTGITSWVRSKGKDGAPLVKVVRGTDWNMPSPLSGGVSDRLLRDYVKTRSFVHASGKTLKDAPMTLPPHHAAYKAAKAGGSSGNLPGGDADMVKYDFNRKMSEHLGARRANPVDLRPSACKGQHDSIDQAGLLPCTVIICMVNEEWWALLRTIHSILENSHDMLIDEIIIVDDGSDTDAPWLGKKLEAYLASLPKVTLLRMNRRSGLVAARLRGARRAKSEVLVFLDSHIEVNVGWLPPLIERVSDDPTVVASPVVAVIDKNSLNVQGVSNYDLPYGMFAWDMNFRWSYVQREPAPWQAPSPKPGAGVKSPTFAGGLFAAHRKYFFDVGSYDANMTGWGGENIEMALRLWQCGGGIEVMPCSIVSHIFRDKNPTKFPGTTAVDVTEHNLIRAAEVWMDEYKERFYESKPWLRSKGRAIDVSERLREREAMGCRPFSWYLDALHPSDFLMSRGQALRRGWLYVDRPKNPPPGCLVMSQSQSWMLESRVTFPCGHGTEAIFYFTEAGSIEVSTQAQSFPFLTLCLTFQTKDRIDGKPCKLARDAGSVPTVVYEEQRFDPDQSIRMAEDLALRQRWRVSGMDVISQVNDECLMWVGEESRGHLATRPCGSQKTQTEAEKSTSLYQPIEFHGDGRFEDPHMWMQRAHGFVGSEPGKQEAVRKPKWQPVVAAKGAKLKLTTPAQVSDTLPLDRPVIDWRSPACRTRWPHQQTAWAALPDASVVIAFSNEAKSLLYRTLHSIFNRSPKSLLREIILVDDASTESHLGSELETYVSLSSFLGKVKVVRMRERVGLIRARQRGIKEASATVVVLLDSHIEVQPGWLPPLLTRLDEDRTRMVMPHIDSISPKTLATSAGGIGVLGFMWNMQEHGIPPLYKDIAMRGTDNTAPLRTPVISGGAMAFNKQYFLSLGGFDEGMGYWGGEALELSFRVWQCGGKLELVHCSRVSHLFRTEREGKNQQGGAGATGVAVQSRYTMPRGHLLRNKLRVALVWLDEPQRQVALSQFGLAAATDEELQKLSGDLTKRLALKNKLQCRPFQWYLDEVYPSNALNLVQSALAVGKLKNVATGLCLYVSDLSWAKYNQALTLRPCVDNAHGQSFVYSSQRDIRSASLIDKCIDYSPSKGGVVLFDCSNNRRLGSQQWLVSEAAETPPAPAGSAAATASAVFTEWVSPHRSSQRTIKHVSGRCLVAATEGTRNMTRVALEDCDLNAASVPLLRGVAQDELSRRGIWEWVSEHA